ncbi:hypothetical protein, variant 1 [Verruconis gallopava]|nr:hypothetical protein, variant 1 [Verruconis gallopava]KIW06437.1 hypothetical protein, variant 1 [Verruconis gallopava]
MAIRGGRNVQVRLKAIKVALAMVSGAYSTGLVTYFTHRDLFPSLMKFVQDAPESIMSLSPFVLLGLLANYNKFEFQNPYRLRLDDFVNELAIKKLVGCIGQTCLLARSRYTEIQEDLPEGWSLGGTLAYIGLGALAGSPRSSTSILSPEEAKKRFASLPRSEATLLLSTYDFANANKMFCFSFVTASSSDTKSEDNNTAPPFSSYLSLTSYLLQHAHRSTRAAHYTYLTLFTLQILVEDQALAKRLCSEESQTRVRLCRQRQPFLPLVQTSRVLMAAILDVCVDGVNHNLKRRLDVELYILMLGVLLRIISYLGRSKSRLVYHWSELWRSLLSFIRFLNTYVSDIKPLYRSHEMISVLVNLIALSLSTGESFLPDTASYDDLFYKLVETGDILTKFRDAYSLGPSKSGTSSSGDSAASSVETLISVSRHYHALLEGDGRTKGKKNLSPREVGKVIQSGYESLSISAREGLDTWEKYREADHRNVLKRMARIVIDDTKSLVKEL